MLSIDTILYPTDFSACAEAAFPYAVDLARRHNAELHMLHVAPVFGDNPLRGVFEAGVDEVTFYQGLRDAADERMQELLSSQDISGVQVKRVHSRGAAPGEVITEYAVAEDVDLIVLGTHGRRGLRKWLLGSVAQEVIHRALCPVWVVREANVPDTDSLVNRILAPIDFSVHSVHALAYAKELAARYGATLDVLYVIDPVMDEQLRRVGWKNRSRAERKTEAQVQEKLVWLSNEVAGPVEVDMTLHVSVGNPPVQIVEHAKESKADLIVMASHGLNGRDLFPLGSVTERILRTAPCPVFMPRPFEKTLLPPDSLVSEIDLAEGEIRSQFA